MFIHHFIINTKDGKNCYNKNKKGNVIINKNAFTKLN